VKTPWVYLRTEPRVKDLEKTGGVKKLTPAASRPITLLWRLSLHLPPLFGSLVVLLLTPHVHPYTLFSSLSLFLFSLTPTSSLFPSPYQKQ
jgi:hypothetical protein